MAKLEKGLHGVWISNDDLIDGSFIKIESEIIQRTSIYKNDRGDFKTQFVGKISLPTSAEPFKKYLCRFNATSIEGMIDAFGDESSKWIGEILTIKKEKTTVGNKRQEVVYFIPDSYKLAENDEGYLNVIPE